MKNEFDDVKELVDVLTVQTAVNTIKIQNLTSMVLGVYFQTLPKENAGQIVANLCDVLEKELMDGLDTLADGLFNPGVLIHQKLVVLEQIHDLRGTFC